jgi:hypothetical protein
VIDLGTVLWMVGLLLVAAAGGWALAGAVGAVAAVGFVLVLEGAAVDLSAGGRSVPARDRERV